MKKLLIVVLVSLVIAGAIWLRQHTIGIVPQRPARGDSAAEPRPLNSERLTLEVAASKRASAQQPPPTTHEPIVVARPVMLPPPSARVAEYFDELSQRADAGDMSAACRLAYELDTCRRIPELQRYAAEIGSAAIARPKGATKAYDDLFVKTTLDIEVASRRCEGVQRAWMQNAWKYLFALARSGNDEAAVRFALAPPLDRADMIDNLDAWQVYRESAVPLLERAATNGDPHAMHALQLALSGTPVFLGSRTIIAKDPARALELGFALERVADAKTVAWLLQQRDELRATLSPEEFQRRSHAGTALYERLLASVEPLDFDSSSFRAEPESRCGQP